MLCLAKIVPVLVLKSTCKCFASPTRDWSAKTDTTVPLCFVFYLGVRDSYVRVLPFSFTSCKLILAHPCILEEIRQSQYWYSRTLLKDRPNCHKIWIQFHLNVAPARTVIPQCFLHCPNKKDCRHSEKPCPPPKLSCCYEYLGMKTEMG